MPGWEGAAPPPWEAVGGRWCRLEPLTKGHGPALFDAFSEDDGSMWTYLGWGAFMAEDELKDLIEWIADQPDWLGFAVVTPDGIPRGMACYLRIDPAGGVVEVGAIAYAPSLARTRAATEAMYLMADRAFTTGYRRYEWKCDALNAKSRSAAERLGFTYEGTFRQALVYKGRNRDNAWYSILDHEWTILRIAYLRWLDPANFGPDGTQRVALRHLISDAIR